MEYGRMLLITVIILLVLFSVILLWSLAQAMQENQRLKEELWWEDVRSSHLLSDVRQLVRFRRTLRTRMMAIEYLLKEGRSEAGASALVDIVTDFAALSSGLESVEEVWNLVLEAKLEGVSDKGIRVDKEIHITDLGGLKERNFVVLLSGLLEEALENLKHQEGPWLKVVLKSDEGYLYLEVTYPVGNGAADGPGGKGKKGITHKRRLAGLRKVVKEQHGTLAVDRDQGLCQVRVLLPNRREAASPLKK